MHSVKKDHFANLMITHNLTANKLRCIVSHTNEPSFSWEMLCNFKKKFFLIFLLTCNFLKEICTKLCLKINK